MKHLSKKIISAVLVLCIAVLGIGTMEVSAAAYKKSVSKKLSFDASKNVTITFTLKKDAEIAIMIQAADKQTGGFGAFHTNDNCPCSEERCGESSFSQQSKDACCFPWDDMIKTDKPAICIGFGEPYLKFKKGEHHITIFSQGSGTQNIKAAVKAVDGRKLIKMGSVSIIGKD